MIPCARPVKQEITMMRLVLLFLPLMMVASLQAWPQPPGDEGSNLRARRAFKRALAAYELLDYRQALEAAETAIALAPQYSRAHLLRAEVLYLAARHEESAEAYSAAINLLAGRFPQAFFYRGMAYYKSGNYVPADQDFRHFLANGTASRTLTLRAEEMLASCAFALEAMKNPVPFDPVNPGPAINTAEAEYSPAITADGETLVFTRRSAVNERIPGRYYEVENFYVSHLENGEWTPAISLGPPINTPGNEGAQSLSANGRELYFTACNRPDGYGSCDIYYARRTGDAWSVPVNLGDKVNSSSWESHPSISSDGNNLYFSSGRRGSIGKMDIWASRRDEQGNWQLPENLGEVINTTGREMSPFIHPDNRSLYFASDGHSGMGGLDLFFSRLDDEGNWSRPVNLGYPINTHADEFSLVIDAAGKTAWFASDREGGFGKMDLYSFTLYDDARPAPMTYMKGIVFEKDTNIPLEASFELIELGSGSTIIQSASDPVTGEFLVVIPLETPLALNVSLPGYLFYSEHFNITETRTLIDPYLKDISLQRIRPGESVVLRNLFFRTGSHELDPASVAELERLARLLWQNPEIHIHVGGHTDNVGSYEDNLVLSESRAKSVVLFLVEKGILPGRISFRGYADTQAVDTNETASGRANNRRTEFTIVDPANN